MSLRRSTMTRMWPALCLLSCLLLCVAGQKKCRKKHPYVGLECPIATYDHEVSGVVVPKDDCSFRIMNFTWDGEGPAVYVTAFEKPVEDGDNPPDDEKTLLEMLPPGDPYDGSEVLTFKLPKTLTWDDIRTVSIWCETFAINFGSAIFPHEDDL